MCSVRSHISNLDGNWGTMRFRMSSLASVVSSIHFVAHENIDNIGGDGQSPTNHWTFFLTLEDGSFVHIDATPNEPGRPGMIVLENSTSVPVEDHIHEVSGTVLLGTTVEDVLAVLIKNGRDRYKFHPIGEGCRFWLYTISLDFADAGIVDSSVAEDARDALSKYWPSPNGTPAVSRPMARGEFY
ncbi:hypothetical protein K474DRAFT_1607040 [Panus rudis PR-1116 ss-1]|nr:hypothetical protein K474DRAFT_1607040 [Panus rudis PR-1116 ss-1]